MLRELQSTVKVIRLVYNSIQKTPPSWPLVVGDIECLSHPKCLTLIQNGGVSLCSCRVSAVRGRGKGEGKGGGERTRGEGERGGWEAPFTALLSISNGQSRWPLRIYTSRSGVEW